MISEEIFEIITAEEWAAILDGSPIYGIIGEQGGFYEAS